MKILALLSWYDEPVGQLAETVAALGKLVDHVLAVDGAYLAFPDALRRPTSPGEQAEVIARTASGSGIGCTVHTPSAPWSGGEVEKRDWMFRAAETMTGPGDWLVIVDADEVLTSAPADTRGLLEESDTDVAELVITASDGTFTPDRRLIRAQSGLHVEGAHYVWTAPGGRVLRGNPSQQNLAPADVLWDVRLDHRPDSRNSRRQRHKAEYYRLIPELERIPA